jgi:hypothetical protein
MADDDGKTANPVDPAPSSDRATGAGSQASMRHDDGAEHPYASQGDRHAVRGERGDPAADPLDPEARADRAEGSDKPSRLEGSDAARTPEPFIGDPESLSGPPTEAYTSEPVARDQDAGNDSG